MPHTVEKKNGVVAKMHVSHYRLSYVGSMAHKWDNCTMSTWLPLMVFTSAVLSWTATGTVCMLCGTEVNIQKQLCCCRQTTSVSIVHFHHVNGNKDIEKKPSKNHKTDAECSGKINHAYYIIHEDIMRMPWSWICRMWYILTSLSQVTKYGTKMKLLMSYCYSLYGCVRWKLTNPCIERVCRTWRAGLRRVWCLPRTTHSELLPFLFCLCSFEHVSCSHWLLLHVL